MARKSEDPVSFLPLTAVAFQVLLALAESSLHGYAIIKDVRERSAGQVSLRTGTLYTLLQRLTDEGLIRPVAAEEAHGESDDNRRRYYGLTPLGSAVLRAEAVRLDALVAEARRRRVFSGMDGE